MKKSIFGTMKFLLILVSVIIFAGFVAVMYRLYSERQTQRRGVFLPNQKTERLAGSGTSGVLPRNSAGDAAPVAYMGAAQAKQQAQQDAAGAALASGQTNDEAQRAAEAAAAFLQ